MPTNSRTPRSTEVAGAAVGADYEYGYEYGYGDSGQQQQYPHQQYQQSGYGDNYALSRSSNSAAFGTGADGAGGGASAPSAVGEEEGVNEDQFVETMRNLQGLVGQRAVSGGLATDKRKMSEMSAQYTEVHYFLIYSHSDK